MTNIDKISAVTRVQSNSEKSSIAGCHCTPTVAIKWIYSKLLVTHHGGEYTCMLQMLGRQTAHSTHMHTHTQPFYGSLDFFRYQKKHSPTHTYHSHQSSLICFVHLLWSIAFLFILRAWQSFSTISLQVFFRLDVMKHKMVGWQWHQLYHMQVICTLLQTDNRANILSLNFLTGQIPFVMPKLPNQHFYSTEGK